MSVLGIIAEYNPMHNGHLFHFNTSREITQAEYSICVISGNFVQRGEPAIVDKWSRARMALSAGFDLVVELPVVYCVQSAEFFGYGAVSILNSLGIVGTLSFGSEIGDIGLLNEVGDILANEPDEFKDYIKLFLSNGCSFPSARAKALVKYMHQQNHIDSYGLEEVLSSSNNILGLEYIKWLRRLDSHIKPITIARVHSKYNDELLNTKTASALAVRKAVMDGHFEKLKEYIPPYAVDILKYNFKSGRGPIFLEDFEQAILCKLRAMSHDELSRVMDVGEGLEYRIKKAAQSSGSLHELIGSIKTKRYTETRIRRILIHCLLGINSDDMAQFKGAGGPQYIRVLGFSQNGRVLLQQIKKTCSIPVITNFKEYKKFDNIYLKRMIELDSLATDIYVSSYNTPELRRGGLDYIRKPEMI